MKVIASGLNSKGLPVITVEETVGFFFKKNIRREFVAARQSMPGYWDWSELPDNLIVSDYLSFQLNHWAKLITESAK